MAEIGTNTAGKSTSLTVFERFGFADALVAVGLDIVVGRTNGDHGAGWHP